MNRCLPSSIFSARARAAGWAVAVLCAWLPLVPSAQAQVQSMRNFPAHVERARMEVLSAVEVRLNGRPDRLGAGVRIRSAQNLIVPATNLVGQRVMVNYQRDASGLVSRVWVLTPDEAAQPTPKQLSERYMRGAQNERGMAPDLDPAMPRDDGKTPFDKLPRYRNPY